MVYSFDYIGKAQHFLYVQTLFPHPNTTLLFLTFALIAWVFYFQICQNQFLFYFAALLSFASIYIFTTAYYDEVYINLEHAWNLYHHGLFSFSPKKLILGTVEILYYLLLTPFAATQTSLIYTSYLFGAMLGYAHLILFYKLVKSDEAFLNFIYITFFVVSLPLMCVFSCGFGGAFLSLCFLIAVFLYAKGKKEAGLIVAAFLPIIRPDAIAYSASFILVDALLERKIRWLPIMLAMTSLFVYFLTVKIFYGIWIPTPLALKSFTWKMIPLIPHKTLKELLEFFTLMHIAKLTVIFFGLFFKKTSQVRFLYYLTLPLGGLFVFYTVTALWKWALNARYYAPFEMLLILLPAMLLKKPAELFFKRFKERLPQPQKIYLCAVIFCFLILVFESHSKIEKADYFIEMSRSADLGVGGQILDQILPQNWEIAATELNTFGLMNDREIVDLWGFTNPAILEAHLVSAGLTRINPHYLLKALPRVVWYRTRSVDHLFKSEWGNTAEETLTRINFSKKFHNYGDVTEVLNRYDVFSIKTMNWKTFLLVRKDMSNQAKDSILNSGYILSEERPLNFKIFRNIYDEQVLKVFSV